MTILPRIKIMAASSLILLLLDPKYKLRLGYIETIYPGNGRRLCFTAMGMHFSITLPMRNFSYYYLYQEWATYGPWAWSSLWRDWLWYVAAQGIGSTFQLEPERRYSQGPIAYFIYALCSICWPLEECRGIACSRGWFTSSGKRLPIPDLYQWWIFMLCFMKCTLKGSKKEWCARVRIVTTAK